MSSRTRRTIAGTRPLELAFTQQGDRAEAAQHDQRARSHEAKYDPHAEAEAPAARTPYSGSVEDEIYLTYNPTEEHREAAREHDEHARQHREAATALERHAKAHCARIPPAMRPVCPLLGAVASVENTSKGVRIGLPPGMPREAVLEHMQCHHAFAGMVHFEGMDACPLYVRGATIRAGDGPTTVEIISDDDAVAREIQRRVKQHVVATGR